MTPPDKKTLLNERGIRVEVEDNPEAIAIENVYLRQADPLRRFYVFEVTTRIKYPAVVGLGGSSTDNDHEVYIDGTADSIYYGNDEGQEYPDGLPGMAVLNVILPKHTHFWHKLFHPRERWSRPGWHVVSNEFHDKYSVELVAWYA